MAPVQEEKCDEIFEKSCQITFKPEATTEVVRKCYRPKTKNCNGQGPQQCKTEYETSCTTRYVESSPGKYVGDTQCEKLPVSVCGSGCIVVEAPEECHDKEIDTLVDVPEEVCDLNPQKTCRLVTRLVPSLKPRKECTIVPKETCHFKLSTPKIEKKPLRTEWCQEDTLEEERQSGIQPRVTQKPEVVALPKEDLVPVSGLLEELRQMQSGIQPKVTQTPDVLQFPQQELGTVSELLDELRRLRRNWLGLNP